MGPTQVERLRFVAVVIYHTEGASKGVYSISKPARELPTKGVQGF